MSEEMSSEFRWHPFGEAPSLARLRDCGLLNWWLCASYTMSVDTRMRLMDKPHELLDRVCEHLASFAPVLSDFAADRGVPVERQLFQVAYGGVQPIVGNVLTMRQSFVLCVYTPVLPAPPKEHDIRHLLLNSVRKRYPPYASDSADAFRYMMEMAPIRSK